MIISASQTADPFQNILTQISMPRVANSCGTRATIGQKESPARAGLFFRQ